MTYAEKIEEFPFYKAWLFGKIFYEKEDFEFESFLNYLYFTPWTSSKVREIDSIRSTMGLSIRHDWPEYTKNIEKMSDILPNYLEIFLGICFPYETERLFNTDNSMTLSMRPRNRMIIMNTLYDIFKPAFRGGKMSIEAALNDFKCGKCRAFKKAGVNMDLPINDQLREYLIRKKIFKTLERGIKNEK